MSPRRQFGRSPSLNSFVLGLAFAVSVPAAHAYERKNYKNLTAQEKQDFVNACLALKSLDPGATDDTILGWDDFVKLHRDNTGPPLSANYAHQGPAFLAWHREYLLRMEDALRSVNNNEFPNVTIPYWDWTDCTGDPDCFPDALGGTGTGPAPFTVDVWPIFLRRSTVFGVGQPLERSFGTVGSLPGASNVQDALDVSIFDCAPWDTTSSWGSSSFRNRLEGWSPYGLHNKVHVWVGGDMVRETSPNDPIFFMHHANVDRIWCQWQVMHGCDFHHIPMGGQNSPWNIPGEARLGHNAFDEMTPFEPTMPFDMLNMRALGYEYDDCRGPCELTGFPGRTFSQVMMESCI